MQALPAAPGISHTEEGWEKIKPVFVELYQTRGFTLPLVRSFLAEKYGFHATIRQYKTRITKWEIHKKESLNRDRARVLAAGKKEIARGERAAVTPWEPARDPPQYRYRPPVISRSPDLPAQHRAVYAAIYGVGRFHFGILNANLDQTEVRSQSDGWVIRQFYDSAHALSALAAASEWDKVQSLYGQMLGFAGPLLRERNPIVIVCIIQACCRFVHDGQTAVIRRFLSFLVGLASTEGQRSHPLRMVLAALGKSGAQFDDLLAVCAQRTLDILTEMLGPEHPQALSATRALIAASYVRRDYSTALKTLYKTEKIERKLYPGSHMFVDLQRSLATCLLATHDLEGAAAVMDEMEDTLCKGQRPADAANFHQRNLTRLLTLRGELFRQKGDIKAIDYIEEALAIAKPDIELRNAWSVRFLETFLEATKSSLKDKSHPQSVPMIHI
ncbi:hypothetical protein GQ53DRAFT_835425 [Thozetella sp. PMI_491]|nr:hypothetical protein GQ53DRAFT_835425 [Thozetella sp. PMI_491]